MSVKVEHVSKYYDKQKALNDVSFDVPAGQVVGFLGPNGAGKSTMMKIITCYIPQSQGRVEVSGFDVATEAGEVRSKVGYLPEHNPLYLDMYIVEFLEFIARIHAVKDKSNRIKEMIAVTGLTPEKHKKIGALSKGYRQRTGLAAALIHDPEVLILDEPTSGLDPNQITEIRQLIKDTGQQKTVILSTHILQEVNAMCNRVIIINNGKVVADDSVENLQSTLSAESALLIEFDKYVHHQELQQINGIVSVKHLGENQYRLVFKQGYDSRKNIFEFAVNKNIAVLTMRKEEQNLEQIFHDLTAGKK